MGEQNEMSWLIMDMSKELKAWGTLGERETI
jgi:hypothetical protein